jgi:glycogen synthase
LETQNAVIAHFHEWPSCLAAFLAKKRKLDLTTIFTAHATVLGRDFCEKMDNFYTVIESIDVDKEGPESPVYHRHVIERLGAQYCDVLTTVSNITDLECEYLLGRKSDAILPNGMNLTGAAPMHNESVFLRHTSKLKIRDFIRGHFYGQLNDVDPDNSLYLFTAGRYEFSNKGADMFIESLARLNQRLKEQKDRPTPTVIAFIIMNAKPVAVSTEALHRQAIVKTLQDAVNWIERSVARKLLDRTLNWREGDAIPTETELISDEENASLRRRLYGVQRDCPPPVVTHTLADEENDPVLRHLRRFGLTNAPDDRVKVIFIPEFLRSSSPLFPVDYDEFVRGTHLGVFPSKYEPWGYTPAECVARGIPALTTNVSGFGSYMERLLRDVSGPEHGLYIVDRRAQTYEEAVGQMAESLYEFSQSRTRDRVTQRNHTARLGEILDWSHMNIEYRKTRSLALRRVYSQGYFSVQKDLLELVPEVKQRSELFLSSAACTPLFEL